MTHTRITEVEETLRRVAEAGGGSVTLHSDFCAIDPCTCKTARLWQPPFGDGRWSVPVQFGGSQRRWMF